MTGKHKILSDFEDLMEAFVAFRSDPKWGKVTVDCVHNPLVLKNIVPSGDIILFICKGLSADESYIMAQVIRKDKDLLSLAKLLFILEMMVTQELVANAMNDESRQAFEEEKKRNDTKRRSNTPNVSAASTSTGANADDSSFVYLGGKIPNYSSTIPNVDLPIDPNMPDLEDASDTLPNDGIFNGAYDDDKDVGRSSSAVQTRGEDSKASSAQQALLPRAWYETLSFFLLENGFRIGTIDKTLFIKKNKSDIMLVQVYVDDIIFGSTKKSMCTEFEEVMHKRFQISSIGEFTFFLGLQVKQQPDGIFISQDNPWLKDEDDVEVDVHEYRSMIGSLMYLTASRPDIMFAVCACARFQVTPKASHLHAVKRIFRYLKHQPKLGLWYPRDSPFELEAFSDSDYAGASLDRKSTTGGCQFLGRRLISWQCKKQTIVANSTTEAEYVATAHCCGQVLWIQNQMMDYGFNFMNTKIHIDNESTICVVKNPVYHSRTKHIEIRHHFIRDCYEKRLIEVIKIHTDHNVADLLTKGFDVTRFNFLVVSIGMLNL
ncbi:putative ribonuclease H-like domain-containing protein [Tanacetum coccineum]